MDDEPYQWDGMTSDLFSQFTFGSVTIEPSDEMELAVAVLKASSALSDLADYFEEHELDITEIDHRDVTEMDHDERLVMQATIALTHGLNDYAEAVEDDDDDDDNPFKVSDGDDPIY